MGHIQSDFVNKMSSATPHKVWPFYINFSICVQNNIGKCIYRGIEFSNTVIEFSNTVIEFSNTVIEFSNTVIEFSNTVIEFSNTAIQIQILTASCLVSNCLHASCV